MDTAGVVTKMQQLQSKDEIKWDGINNYANIDKKQEIFSVWCTCSTISLKKLLYYGTICEI